MREVTKTFKVYEYAELTDAAKDKAFSKWHASAEADIWDSEWRRSMQAYADLFQVKMDHWSVGSYHNDFSYRQYETDYTPKAPKYKQGMDEARYRVRLAKFIQRVYREAYKDKFDCPFTGYCGDMPIVDHIRRAYSWGITELSLFDFLQNAADSFFSAWTDDRAYQISRGAFEELANDYGEYLEDGSVYIE